jgi:hypothetical protein
VDHSELVMVIRPSIVRFAARPPSSAAIAAHLAAQPMASASVAQPPALLAPVTH